MQYLKKHNWFIRQMSWVLYGILVAGCAFQIYEALKWGNHAAFAGWTLAVVWIGIASLNQETVFVYRKAWSDANLGWMQALTEWQKCIDLLVALEKERQATKATKASAKETTPVPSEPQKATGPRRGRSLSSR